MIIEIEDNDVDVLRYALRTASVHANSGLLVEQISDQHAELRAGLAAYQRVDQAVERVTGTPNPFGPVGEGVE